MPLEETSGTCRQFTCKYHAWRYDLDGNLTFVQQERRVLRPRQEPLRAGAGALRGLGGLHLRQLRQAARTVAARIPGPDDHRAGGLSVRHDDVAVVLPLRGEGELEALHGRVPGVLPRTCAAREPVAVGVFEGGSRGRLRGAALPHRRPAPVGQHLGCARVGDGPRDAQADGGHLPTAGCSARGTSRISASCRRVSTPPSATRGAWIRSSCSRTS